MLSPHQEKLDCFVSVVTPENVEFEYALAGPFQRLPAFLFDVVVRTLLLISVITTMTFVLSALGWVGQVLSQVVMILLTFLVNWFYGAILETRFNGQTFGKMVFKLRVISVDGRPINGVQAALRNLLRFADIYPSPLVGLTCMAISKRYQRVGDLVAGTMVVLERPTPQPTVIQPEDARAFGLADLIPPTFIPSLSLTQAVAMYMESRRRLPVSRRTEVASKLAQPLIRKFALMPDTSSDLLLCALYVKIFMSVQQQDRGKERMRQTFGVMPGKAIPSSALPPNLGLANPISGGNDLAGTEMATPIVPPLAPVRPPLGTQPQGIESAMPPPPSPPISPSPRSSAPLGTGNTPQGEN